MFRPRGTTPSRIIPALAGNTRMPILTPCSGTDHPRSRGEYHIHMIRMPASTGSSPLSRGIPMQLRRNIISGGIIPALAGNTRRQAETLLLFQDHPRSRGEYRLPLCTMVFCGGSSPLSRGILTVWRDPDKIGGIIPALAGNTSWHWPRMGLRKDHPRSRGEYLLWKFQNLEPLGSSPLSRGIPAAPLRAGTRGRIIPALAGNTSPTGNTVAQIPDHPRSRGEYYSTSSTGLRQSGSSPLSRGIRFVRLLIPLPSRIIPALAGNTGQVLKLRRLHPDHPRSRGEYLPIFSKSTIPCGSSPLSRGIRRTC